MADARAPLALLMQVNGLQAWRRLTGIGRQSTLLCVLSFGFMAGYFAFSFWLFYRALRFLGTFPGLGAVLVERLLFLLFAFLFVLLLFSNLVISYSNLFRNRETSFLLTLPVPRADVFRWKFMESTLLASWAFLFLIAPLLAAYGLNHQEPWHFYLLTLVLIALFLILPAVLGGWLAIQLARYLDRRSLQIGLLTLGVALLAGAAVWLKPQPITDDMLETRVLAVLDRLLVRTQFAQWPLLPSYWLSASVLHWSEGALASAGFFGLVLLSHVLFFGSLAFSFLGDMLYDASSAVQSRASVLARWGWFQTRQRRRQAFGFTQGPVEKLFRCVPGLTADRRALLVKDVRVFWRDTTQWSQTLVLFGLLGAYIINLRHFSHQLSNPFWVSLVAYLNLGACSLNLATLTTRFVYPQFSLEGKRLWIIGLAPLGLRRVLQIKFCLAVAASLVITLGLIGLSCHMLEMSWQRRLYFGVATTVMTFSLNGLAVGLGALYPNFKEDNPSKIVSGFGGTFCLVVSFLYIVAAVALLALGAAWGAASSPASGRVLGSWTAFVLLSALIGWLPVRLGLRRVTQVEL